jgi:tRNA/tmRNA/rRNA uracil-C5-methylase (TrmA/RlmC/RlmD family)
MEIEISLSKYYYKYLKYKKKYLEIGNLENSNIFAKKDGIEYDKLIITDEGKYSITKRKDGEKLLEIIKKEIKTTEDKTITDLTGCVGGDTILFGLNFKKVYSIEYNNNNYKALENNVKKVYNLENVKLFHGDSTQIYNWKTDVLYLDPPWGGVNYKEKNRIDLYLGDIRVDIFLDKILERENRPKYIFLKLPRNYNFDRLYKLKNKIKIRNYTIRGYNIIFIK